MYFLKLLIETGELRDFITCIIYLALFILFIIKYNKYYHVFSEIARSIHIILIVFSAIVFFRCLFFIIEYTVFKDSINYFVNNIGDILWSMCLFFIAADHFKKYKKIFNKKEIVYVLLLVVFILMFPMQLQKPYWNWAEYIITFTFLLLAVIFGIKTLTYYKFSLLLYIYIVFTFMGNVICFYGFVIESLLNQEINVFFIKIAENIDMFNSFFLLLFNIFYLAKKNS